MPPRPLGRRQSIRDRRRYFLPRDLPATRGNTQRAIAAQCFHGCIDFAFDCHAFLDAGKRNRRTRARQGAEGIRLCGEHTKCEFLLALLLRDELQHFLFHLQGRISRLQINDGNISWQQGSGRPSLGKLLHAHRGSDRRRHGGEIDSILRRLQQSDRFPIRWIFFAFERAQRLIRQGHGALHRRRIFLSQYGCKRANASPPKANVCFHNDAIMQHDREERPKRR